MRFRNFCLKGLLLLTAAVATPVSTTPKDWLAAPYPTHNVQQWAYKRVNVTRDIVYVTMKPADGDGYSGKPCDISGGGKQRNEISLYKPTSLRVAKGATSEATFEMRIHFNAKYQWFNPYSSGFYHMFQVKHTAPSTRPEMTIGLYKSKIAVYDCDLDSGHHTMFVPKPDQPIKIKLDIRNTAHGYIRYNINGYEGRHPCSSHLGKYPLYFKFGQYRKYPNKINTTIVVSFRNMKFSSP